MTWKSSAVTRKPPTPPRDGPSEIMKGRGTIAVEIKKTKPRRNGNLMASPFAMRLNLKNLNNPPTNSNI